SLDEIRQMCQWILENLGPDVPLHFTAFHPDFRMQDRGPTPPETLLAAYDVARSLGLNYVYAGNVHAPRQGSTWCPGCGELLIERDWYNLGRYQLDGNRCRKCGYQLAGHFEEQPGNWGRKRLPVRIADFASHCGAGVPPAGKDCGVGVSPADKTSETATFATAEMKLPVVTASEVNVNLHQERNQNGSTTMNEAISVTPALNVAVMSAARPELTAEQKQTLLRAAARVVAATATGRPITLTDAGLDPFGAVPVLGAFVTLRRNRRLRSCCGAMSDSVNLAHAVFHAAVRSTIDDHRFPAVTPHELAYLDLDVWVLHTQRQVTVLGEARREVVTIGKHGLQIAAGDRRGLLLPGVAVENNLDAESFLQQVCLKAGLHPTAWKDDHTVLSTFEGEMVDGELHQFLDGHAVDGATALRLMPADLTGLADFCLGNIWAALSGATPSYYAFGVSDDNVHGIALSLEDAKGNAWLQSTQLSLRKLMPLQSSLFAQSQEIGRALAGRGFAAGRLAELRLKLAILYDPAMHGSVAAPDLRGFDASRQSLIVAEANKSAVVFDQEGLPDVSLALARKLARVTLPENAAIYSAVTLSNVTRLTVASVPAPQPGARVRPAAVAGTFYPSDADELAGLVDDMLSGPPITPEVWPAVMTPHAGLKYSGRLAADVLRRVVIPERVIVIGPKHTSLGVERAVAPHESWSIPGAVIPADPEMARDLVEAIPGLQLDAAAHQQEHAIEVELPFIARLAPHARVTGIVIGSGNLARCRDFADGLAACLQNRPGSTLLVISSDMNHFANDTETRRLDELALAAMESLDPEALYDVVRRQHISMCGLLPAVIVMETLQRLGGLNRIHRVGYATSGDITGDRTRVVGYAGMLLG
ncbi:MAG: AmmeMemoRadiSam system protein B, partial [Pirellulales bacterium]